MPTNVCGARAQSTTPLLTCITSVPSSRLEKRRLLYIGQTYQQSVSTRLQQPDHQRRYAAFVKNYPRHRFSVSHGIVSVIDGRLTKRRVDDIERLLIYANDPCMPTMSNTSINTASEIHTVSPIPAIGVTAHGLCNWECSSSTECSRQGLLPTASSVRFVPASRAPDAQVSKRSTVATPTGSLPNGFDALCLGKDYKLRCALYL